MNNTDKLKAFLCGEGRLNGLWFGERPDGTTNIGKFWWRKDLKAAFKGYESEIAELKKQLGESKWISVDDRLPDSSVGHWSKPVIAECDLGLIYKISHFGGDSDCWQRPESFVNNLSKRIVRWMPYEPPEGPGE